MRFSVLLCFFASIGCAQIPVAQFEAYTKAFSEAKPAAEAVLADYSAAKEELARLEAPAPVVDSGLPYPASYTPPADGTEPLDDVAVRFLALQAIIDYNAALGQLVGGASVGAQQQSIDGFVGAVSRIVTLAGGSVPAIAPAVAALQSAAAEIEKARLAGEFQQALRDGAPKVAQIIQVLKDDTVDHYRLRFALATRERTLLETSDDGSPMVETALADNAARMEKLRDVLDNYNALLDATRTALLELAHESAQPADLDAILARVVPVVIQLKRDLEAYRNA